MSVLGKKKKKKKNPRAIVLTQGNKAVLYP